MRAAQLLSASLVLAAFAGCVSADSSPGLANPQAQLDLGGGVIEGLVITEELVPIVGATVVADEAPPAITDVGGRFRISGLPIGVTLRVQVLALGYESVARNVQIPGEEAAVELQFMLPKLPTQTPYTELVITSGFEVCTVTTGVFVRAINPCPIGTPSPADKNVAAESWRYLVVETDWDTQDAFWLYVSPYSGCHTGDPCWGQAIGNAPLRVEGAPNDTALAKKYALDGERTFPEGEFEFFVSPAYAGMFREDVNNTAGPQCVLLILTLLGPLGQKWNPNLGCGLGYGVSTGIKYTNYVSIFHWERPSDPATYSGMPDG
jgi:hypothetical protein